ncbi:MAG TPA: lamin tail domain-containing protein [Chitinophagaceae bacterium]|nr:lamin tail domain-containing protein [Chitinophagaceae bacterium]HPN58600.1 lamin tail domain-containing protein [Chitinophagaceae bacterium]HRG23572.1 lamin tail domain-containing protein [Chitinophagaceae bacterium]
MKLTYFISSLIGLALFASSCVKDEIYNGPATISNVAFTPSTVTPDDVVNVTATVTSVKGIEAVTLFYKVNGGTALSVPMVAGASNSYSGSIPKQVDQTTIVLYVGAKTTGGIENSSAEKTYKVGAIPPNYAAIVLNEIDGNTKFVELFNNSAAPVNISGMVILKNTVSLKNPDGTPWSVPAATILPANGYGIIKCSGYTATADPAALIIGTVGDGMSAKQTLSLELVKPDGTSVSLFTRGAAPWGVTISAIPATDSYSRVPNATGTWKLALQTPGKVNGASTGDIPAL